MCEDSLLPCAVANKWCTQDLLMLHLAPVAVAGTGTAVPLGGGGRWSKAH